MSYLSIRIGTVHINTMSYPSHFFPAFGPGIGTSNNLSRLSSGSSRKRRLISSFDDVGPSIKGQGRTSGLRIPNRLSSPSYELAGDGKPESLELDTDTAKTMSHKLKIGLRQQHLNSIIAVLHRSILDHDFERAERAWASLLRAEINGQSFDLRTGSRWGIGAEVLLGSEDWDWKGGGQQSRRSPRSQLENHPSAKASIYFERLVLQHPYRKAVPQAIGPTDYYLAMFSLWIRSIADCSAMEDNRSGMYLL